MMMIGAVVLASGKSERTGKNTLLLRLNGKTLLDNIFDALEAADINDQVIVVGHEPEPVIEAIKPRLGVVKLALDLGHERGMTSSFQTGLVVISNVDAAFLVLGDQPILDPDFLKTMVKELENNGDASIVSPIHNGKKGHPLLFSRRIFGEILNFKSTQTIRDVLHANADKLLTVEAPAWTVMDIETPEDYARLKSLIKNSNESL